MTIAVAIICSFFSFGMGILLGAIVGSRVAADAPKDPYVKPTLRVVASTKKDL